MPSFRLTPAASAAQAQASSASAVQHAAPAAPGTHGAAVIDNDAALLGDVSRFDQADLKRWVSAHAGEILQAASADGATASLVVPVGGIIMWPGAVVPDDTWLYCTGGSYLVSDFPELFALIGYAFGGAGANFNAPQFMERFPIGANGGAGIPVAAAGGENTHVLTTAEMPAHTHPLVDSGGFNIGVADETNPAGATGHYQRAASAVLSVGSTGGGLAHNNMPKYLGINFIIKAKSA